MATTANALCLACGHQNHVGVGFGAKCSSCGEAIRFSTLGTGLKSTFSSPLSLRAWLAIGAGALLVFLWLGSSQAPTSDRSYHAPYETQVSSELPRSSSYAPAFEGTPIAISTGEIRFVGRSERVAPLEIVTRSGSNYFIKVVNANSGLTEVYIFVRGGERVEVLMPLGSYEVKYAAGDVWYGEDLLFGPGTRYSRADAPFQFRDNGYQYEGYTLELFLQTGGNLDVDPISAAEF